MGCHRTLSVALGVVFVLSAFPNVLSAQAPERIWGRVSTTSGEAHEGLIRWDRNEASWADILDGSKEFTEFEYQDWWDLLHPDDRSRDRVVEVAGYRVTWDDDAPDFPSIVESGLRMGHIRRLVPVDRQEARLELRSGRELLLTGGSTDLGVDLRDILVTTAANRTHRLEWENVESVEFFPGSMAGASPRLHGTVDMIDGPSFSGYVGWDLNGVLLSDTLTGFDPRGDRHEVLFEEIAEIRRVDDEEAELTLRSGERLRLSGHEDVSESNDGIQVSDPALGLIDLDWDEFERVRFHSPEAPATYESFHEEQRLRGTVMTSDSTEFTGWVRWDGDEEYSWELLDGRDHGVTFDVEFSNIASLERARERSVSLTIGAQGADVETEREEWVEVTLRDGRTLELDGSNDVDAGNHGIYVLPVDAAWAPDDGEAVWIMIRWDDFRSVHFEWKDGR